MDSREIDIEQVIAMVFREVSSLGSQKAWARMKHISAGHVSDVIRRKRRPGPAILRALVLEEVVRYRPLSNERNQRPGTSGS